MKSHAKLFMVVIAITGTAMTSPTKAGETHRSAKYEHRTSVHYTYGGRYYRYRGGWYALNYPYYWGYGPAVGSTDPYDYNGNYFPSPPRNR